MKKYSKLKKGDMSTEKDESELKYDGYLKVINYKNYEFVKENDMVIILPYLKDESCILLRNEYIPTYQYFYKDIDAYKNITNFLTVISGTVEKGESLKNTIRRELYEEAGVVLSTMYDFDIEKTVFVNKGNIARYHICILELRYNDFKVTTPSGDGSEHEKLSQTIKISLGDLDEIISQDLITEYVLTKFKLDYLKKKK